MKCFWLGSKPGWRYVSQISYPRAFVILSICKGIFHIYNFYIYAISYQSSQFMRRTLHLCICGGTYIHLFTFMHTGGTYCHPKTDCFVVSQLSSVAKHTKCFKLGLKPNWLYISWISYPKAIIIYKNERLQISKDPHLYPAQRLECSPMVRETWVQSQVESYQRL